MWSSNGNYQNEADRKRKGEVAMKAVSWVAGVLGIIVALVGVVGRLRGAQSINVLGGHVPASFLIFGILLVVIGIWLALLGRQANK